MATWTQHEMKQNVKLFRVQGEKFQRGKKGITLGEAENKIPEFREIFEEQEGVSEAVQGFLKSAEMADFPASFLTEDSPLYMLLCRGWMAVNPRSRLEYRASCDIQTA